MSTHVVGFRPPDEKWKKMYTVYQACQAADTSIPEAVHKFFGYETPDESGVSVNLERHECCAEYKADMINGYEIDISKLPENITKIRVYNNW